MPDSPLDKPFGPYVHADGGDLELTIIVKAAPEISKKYGETVCTAAILDDGRLVRIYPVRWQEYRGADFPKYSRVRVRLLPSEEPARRPESHHKQGHFVKLDSPLLRSGRKTPWSKRSALIARAVHPKGMEGLRAQQDLHRTSLGIVRVKEMESFRITAPLDEILRQADFRVSAQQTLTGRLLTEGTKIDKIKHVFRYKWRCFGACCEDGVAFHDTTCEDWELFESFRRWRRRYPDDLVFLEKFKHMYYDLLGQTDLHFIMGTPSHPARQNSWMIVGLYYPGIRRDVDPGQSTRCMKELPPGGVLRVDRAMDHTIELTGKESTRRVPGGQSRLEIT